MKKLFISVIGHTVDKKSLWCYKWYSCEKKNSLSVL